MILPLDSLCADIERYGAVIQAPTNWMPSCGGPINAGMHVALSGDGRKYVLSYTENGNTAAVLETPDKEAILEAVFDEVTANMADENIAQNEPPIGPEDLGKFANLTDDQVRDSAIDFQKKFSVRQEDLLGRLNPVWQKHQAEKNAQKLKDAQNMFGE